MPPITRPRNTYCRIIDAYTEALGNLTGQLSYANRQVHADLIDNNVATYVSKLYGKRQFSDQEACTLLKALNRTEDATAVSDYVRLCTALPLLIEQLNLPLSFVQTMTSLPRGQFRRRLESPELWQPQELAEVFAGLEAYSRILPQFLLDPIRATGDLLIQKGSADAADPLR